MAPLPSHSSHDHKYQGEKGLDHVSGMANLPGAYGQVVIGSAGSGKSTYCHAMRRYLEKCNRDVAIINMDPGNDRIPYECEVDVMELVSLNEVMETMGLGPNGAMIFCMEYIEVNLDWLRAKLSRLKGKYLLFDFPGQLELFIHHDSCAKILDTMINVWEIKLCAVNLLDSHVARTASSFILALSLTLATMLNLALPHLNFLSKIDNLNRWNESLPHKMDTYLSLEDIDRLLPDVDNEIGAMKGHRKMCSKLLSKVKDMGIVRFYPLSVFSPRLLERCAGLTDKTLAYMSEEEIQHLMHDWGVDANHTMVEEASRERARQNKMRKHARVEQPD